MIVASPPSIWENMSYAPTSSWWYSQLDVGCTSAYWFMKEPSLNSYFPCQDQIGAKNMAIAFEKPYHRVLGSSPHAVICSNFDVRMSVKINPVITSLYPNYVSHPRRDLYVSLKVYFWIFFFITIASNSNAFIYLLLQTNYSLARITALSTPVSYTHLTLPTIYSV